jgi:hypothetical protein
MRRTRVTSSRLHVPGWGKNDSTLRGDSGSSPRDRRLGHHEERDWISEHKVILVLLKYGWTICTSFLNEVNTKKNAAKREKRAT